jgi:hypothetical protein
MEMIRDAPAMSPMGSRTKSTTVRSGRAAASVRSRACAGSGICDPVTRMPRCPSGSGAATKASQSAPAVAAPAHRAKDVGPVVPSQHRIPVHRREGRPDRRLWSR